MQRASVTIDEKHLDELESLLNQSFRGFHHVFDHRQVAEILKIPTEEIDFFTFDNIDRIQDLLTQFIECPTFNDKLQFLEARDKDEFEVIVRAYFHIVESSLLASDHELH
jgi:hypothetical protein